MFHPVIWRRQLRDALHYWIVLPAAVLVPALALDRLLGVDRLPWPGLRLATGGLLVVAGCLLITSATRDLARYGGGTPNPARPARRLVTQGSYALCRHPMWLGYDLAGLGVVLALGTVSGLCLTFPLLLFLQRKFLSKEEHILELRFKERYTDYRRRTPMLLPRWRWRR